MKGAGGFPDLTGVATEGSIAESQKRADVGVGPALGTLAPLAPTPPLRGLCLLATGETGFDMVAFLPEILEHSRPLDLPPERLDRPFDTITLAYDEFAHIFPFCR